MPLNRFWPHKTLLWKDWQISWPIFVPFFLFITYATTLSLMFAIANYIAKGGPDFSGRWPEFFGFANRLLSAEPWVGIPLLLFTIALAAVSLGQERERETLGLLLAMPYSRQDILFSKVVMGLGQILLTLVVNALLMTLIIWANAGIFFPFGLPEIWGWAVHSFLVLGFIFCFTLLIAAVSGTTLGNGILALIFLWFPVGFFLLLYFSFYLWADFLWADFPQGYLSLFLLTDFLRNLAQLKTVPLWLLDFALIDNIAAGIFGRFAAFYLYAALVFFSAGAYFLAQFLFSKNPLEKDGEVLIFERLEGIFKLGVVVCFTLLGGPMLTFLIAGGEIGTVILIPSYLIAGGGTWFLINRLLLWRRTG